MFTRKLRFVNRKRPGLAPMRRRPNRSRQIAAISPAPLPELTAVDRNILGCIAVRGLLGEGDMPLDTATRLQAHGLIRFDRMLAAYTR